MNITFKLLASNIVFSFKAPFGYPETKRKTKKNKEKKKLVTV